MLKEIIFINVLPSNKQEIITKIVFEKDDALENVSHAEYFYR